MSKPKRRQIIQFTPEQEAEFEKRVKDYLTTSNHSTLVSRGRKQNKHLKKRSEEGAAKTAAWAKDHPALNTIGLGLSAAPFAVASYPAAVGGGELLGTALANPYVDAGLTSVFAAHGLNHTINEGINGWGDAAITALELAPLGRLAKPLYESTSNIINSAYNKLPWTYRIPENPNMAYRRMGPLERDWIMEGNELGTRDINPATELEREAAVAAEKAKNPNRRFVLFKAGAEHGGRKQFAKGQPWKGTTVTHGEEQVLAIPGEGLPWVSGRHFQGPQGTGFGVGDISFEEAPFGTHIDLLTKEGYTGVNPSLLDGSVIYSPYKIFGHNFGYKKLYPKNTTPQITAENAASMTPEQWTAAQDAAIARGDMAEAQRLRDLHFKVSAPTPYISKGVYLPSGNQPTLSQADYYNGNNDLVTLYHSSVDADNLIKEGFDGVEHGLGRTKGEAKGTIFASANPDYAADYSNLYIQEGLSTPDKVGLMKLKVPRGSGAYEGNEVRLRPEHIKEITKSAYEKTPWLRWLKTRKTDNNLFNIKSANVVTYDDNGVRIPLGSRDNFNINDIRYGLLPFLGLGTASALYKKKQGGKLTINNKLI